MKVALSRDWLWEALLAKFPGDSLPAQQERLAMCTQFYQKGSDDFDWLPKIAPNAFNEMRLLLIQKFLMQQTVYKGASISETIDAVIQTTSQSFPGHQHLVFDYNFRLLRRACLDELYGCYCKYVGTLVTQLEERIRNVRTVPQRSTAS